MTATKQESPAQQLRMFYRNGNTKMFFKSQKTPPPKTKTFWCFIFLIVLIFLDPANALVIKHLHRF